MTKKPENITHITDSKIMLLVLTCFFFSGVSGLIAIPTLRETFKIA